MTVVRFYTVVKKNPLFNLEALYILTDNSEQPSLCVPSCWLINMPFPRQFDDTFLRVTF